MQAELNPPLQCHTATELHLFDVEEVLGIKRYSRASHGNILIQRTTVTDIGLHCKRNCFSLQDRKEGRVFVAITMYISSE